MANKLTSVGISLLLLAVALGIVSCDHKQIYNHYQHTPTTGWEKNDTLTFDVSPMTSAGTYLERVALRIDETYPFLSLCLVIQQRILPSGYVKNDTLNCSLIDKDGFVKGSGISYYQYSFHVNTLKLNAGDSLHIRVKHNMKREIMPGITDIGIQLEKMQ